MMTMMMIVLRQNMSVNFTTTTTNHPRRTTTTTDGGRRCGGKTSGAVDTANHVIVRALSSSTPPRPLWRQLNRSFFRVFVAIRAQLNSIQLCRWCELHAVQTRPDAWRWSVLLADVGCRPACRQSQICTEQDSLWTPTAQCFRGMIISRVSLSSADGVRRNSRPFVVRPTDRSKRYYFSSGCVIRTDAAPAARLSWLRLHRCSIPLRYVHKSHISRPRCSCSHQTNVSQIRWLYAVFASALGSVIKVVIRMVSLLIGWVTVCRRVNRPGI